MEQKKNILSLARRAPVGLHPRSNLYYNPEGTPFYPQGGRDDNRTDPYRLPISDALGGIPEPHAGYKSHSLTITRQSFTIPASAAAYAVDGSTPDDNGALGNIILTNLIDQGRYQLVPRIWNVAISTSESAHGEIQLNFISMTAIMRRISNGEILWSWSSNSPAVKQFYVGIDIPLPPFDSDWYVSVNPEMDAFIDQELSYSAVFGNGASPHAASIFGTFQYDIIEIP